MYSLDRKNEVDNLLSSNPDDPVVLIDARFPRTYHRQSLGFKLNDRQLNQRCVPIVYNCFFLLLLCTLYAIEEKEEKLYLYYTQ